jgi:hypothetical protein
MNGWTEQEEQVIAKIMATEKMLKDQYSVKPTVPCTRAEAIRRARRRHLIGSQPDGNRS